MGSSPKSRTTMRSYMPKLMRPSISSQPMPSTKMLRHSLTQPGEDEERALAEARLLLRREEGLDAAPGVEPPAAPLGELGVEAGWQAP